MTFTENCPSATLALTFNKDLKPGVTASGNSGEGNDSACQAGIVKQYQCDTKTTVDCCPDNGNDCSQPQCGCSSDSDCLTSQHCCRPEEEAWCDPGTCICETSNSELGWLGNDGETCCDPYSEGDYNIELCGCSGNGYRIGDHCCIIPHIRWVPGSGDVEDISGCPCPRGTTEVEDENGSICCSESGLYLDSS